MDRPWRAFAVHALLAAALGALAFLWASDFFAAWEGRAVSARPADADVATRTVLVVEERRTFERRWPAGLVAELALPVDATGVPPTVLPEDRPKTRKRRFSLGFLIEAPSGWRTVPTTTPQALGLGVLVALLGVALRNMAVAGAPWLVAPRERHKLDVQKSGQVVTKGRSAPPSKPGPPPPKPLRGRGRRG